MRVDGFSIHSRIFSYGRKKKTCAKRKREDGKVIAERRDVGKHIPYMVQRKHFDQTFSKSLMVQVHGGAKTSAEEGRVINTQTNRR